MAVNMPAGKNLPFVISGSLDPSGRGDSRADRTGDSTAPPVLTPPSPRDDSITEPRDEDSEPAAACNPTAGLTVADVLADTGDPVDGDDVASLQARFDRMEDLIKRRLAIASLHARFDRLELWLQSNFKGNSNG